MERKRDDAGGFVNVVIEERGAAAVGLHGVVEEKYGIRKNTV